ncbi:retrovirus-related pol polyprotein from transposon TNT 1-94 [Tanacetum coccineum]
MVLIQRIAEELVAAKIQREDLNSDLNSKEATLQVVYDVLKLTPFYKSFQITSDVPEIYMQELWATATVHHHSIRFKINNKKHIVNLEYFREMLQICPKLPDQQFEELPFKEEILTFLRDLGHSGEIKVITNLNVNKLHQLWRSIDAVINKCLSGKSTRYHSLRLSQVQILWGMYHKKNVDYAYLLWEDFVYQDSSIPRRNKVNWHFARDEPMFTTIKVVSRHEDTQLYGVIFPDELTNEAIKDSESYKEYYAIASGAEPLKTKASVKKKQTGSNKTKPPPTTKGKRLKTSAKAAKPAKKKQTAKTSKAKGLTVLSEVALTEAEQIELATKRILIQTRNSHASGSGTDEGTGDIPRVLDVPTYASDDEQIFWKSSNEEDNDEVAMSVDDDDDADNQDDDDNDDDDQNDDNTDNENDDNDDDDDDVKMMMMSKLIPTTMVMTLFIPSFLLMMKKIKKKIALILGFKHLLMLNPLMMKTGLRKISRCEIVEGGKKYRNDRCSHATKHVKLLKCDNLDEARRRQCAAKAVACVAVDNRQSVMRDITRYQMNSSAVIKDPGVAKRKKELEKRARRVGNQCDKGKDLKDTWQRIN